jgi:membrane protein
VTASTWLDFLRAFRSGAREDGVTLIAASVAFYGFLSVVPTLATLVSVYGLIADPDDIKQLRVLSALLPPEALAIVSGELVRLASVARGDLSLRLVVGLAVALWSAQRGMSALCRALNMVYDEREQRRFLQRAVVSLILTVGAIAIATLTLLVVSRLPHLVARAVHLPGLLSLLRWLAWPALAAGMLLGLAVVYRFGAHRKQARWRWITPGSALATALWMAGSWGFSFYLGHFANFDRTYGSMAAIAILMTWFYLTALVILCGAELDAVIAARPAGGRTGRMSAAPAT